MILLGKRSEDIGIVVHGRHARETESSDWETIIVDSLGVTKEQSTRPIGFGGKKCMWHGTSLLKF